MSRDLLANIQLFKVANSSRKTTLNRQDRCLETRNEIGTVTLEQENKENYSLVSALGNDRINKIKVLPFAGLYELATRFSRRTGCPPPPL